MSICTNFDVISSNICVSVCLSVTAVDQDPPWSWCWPNHQRQRRLHTGWVGQGVWSPSSCSIPCQISTTAKERGTWNAVVESHNLGRLTIPSICVNFTLEKSDQPTQCTHATSYHVNCSCGLITYRLSCEGNYHYPCGGNYYAPQCGKRPKWLGGLHSWLILGSH